MKVDRSVDGDPLDRPIPLVAVAVDRLAGAQLLYVIDGDGELWCQYAGEWRLVDTPTTRLRDQLLTKRDQ